MFWYTLTQCFPTFFGSRHPYLILKIFGGTPNWLNRYKDQGIGTFGGTLVCRGTPVGNHCSMVCTFSSTFTLTSMKCFFIKKSQKTMQIKIILKTSFEKILNLFCRCPSSQQLTASTSCATLSRTPSTVAHGSSPTGNCSKKLDRFSTPI